MTDALWILRVHAPAALVSPEINWIRYPWETSAISGFAGMYATEVHPRAARSDLMGVYYGVCYRN